MDLLANQPEELRKRERIIQSGMNTFYAVGNALSEIKEMRLFLATHSTWDEYCRERWGMAARTAYQTIKSAAVISMVDDGTGRIPKTESIARELITINPTDRKKVWLDAIAECPDITAQQLKMWIRKKYHVKDHLPKARKIHRCPNCNYEYEPQTMAGKSRGNRNPSKTPSLFFSEFGRFESAIDYGCGRLRNASEIEKGCDKVIFCDLPEQVDRHETTRDVRPVPIDCTAEVVFLIQVLHIQHDLKAAQILLDKAARHATKYVVIDFPVGQFNHAKEKSGYLRLSERDFSLVGFKHVTTKYSGTVNKMTVLHNCANTTPLSNLLP